MGLSTVNFPTRGQFDITSRVITAAQIAWQYQRRDEGAINSISDSGGLVRITIAAPNAEITAGENIFLSQVPTTSDTYADFGVILTEVSPTIFDTSIPFKGAQGAGTFINLLNSRFGYAVLVDLLDEANVSLGLPQFSYFPDANAFVFIDIGEVMRDFLLDKYGGGLTGPSQLVKISFAEVWNTGSGTTGSTPEVLAVLGTGQYAPGGQITRGVASQFGANKWEQIFKPDLNPIGDTPQRYLGDGLDFSASHWASNIGPNAPEIQAAPWELKGNVASTEFIGDNLGFTQVLTPLFYGQKTINLPVLTFAEVRSIKFYLTFRCFRPDGELENGIINFHFLHFNAGVWTIKQTGQISSRNAPKYKEYLFVYDQTADDAENIGFQWERRDGTVLDGYQIDVRKILITPQLNASYSRRRSDRERGLTAFQPGSMKYWPGWRTLDSYYIDPDIEANVGANIQFRIGAMDGNGIDLGVALSATIDITKEPGIYAESTIFNRRFWINNPKFKLLEVRYNNSETGQVLRVDRREVSDECPRPIMVTWLNEFGAIDSWLFSYEQTVTENLRQGARTETILNDYLDFGNSKIVQKTKTDTVQRVTLTSDNLNQAQVRALKAIAKSDSIQIALDKRVFVSMPVTYTGTRPIIWNTKPLRQSISIELDLPPNVDLFDALDYDLNAPGPYLGGAVSAAVQDVFDLANEPLTQKEMDAMEVFINGAVAAGIWGKVGGLVCPALGDHPRGEGFLNGRFDWKTGVNDSAMLRTFALVTFTEDNGGNVRVFTTDNINFESLIKVDDLIELTNPDPYEPGFYRVLARVYTGTATSITLDLPFIAPFGGQQARINNTGGGNLQECSVFGSSPPNFRFIMPDYLGNLTGKYAPGRKVHIRGDGWPWNKTYTIQGGNFSGGTTFFVITLPHFSGAPAVFGVETPAMDNTGVFFDGTNFWQSYWRPDNIIGAGLAGLTNAHFSIFASAFPVQGTTRLGGAIISGNDGILIGSAAAPERAPGGWITSAEAPAQAQGPGLWSIERRGVDTINYYRAGVNFANQIATAGTTAPNFPMLFGAVNNNASQPQVPVPANNIMDATLAGFQFGFDLGDAEQLILSQLWVSLTNALKA